MGQTSSRHASSPPDDVSSHTKDTKILVQALCDGLAAHRSVEEILVGLDGVSGRSTEEWRQFNRSPPESARPRASSIPPTSSTIEADLSGSHSGGTALRRRETVPRWHRGAPPRDATGADTRDEAPAGSLDTSQCYSPKSHILLPPPVPKTRPTPVIHSKRCRGGVRYTAEDEEFALSLILWEASRNPDITRQDICHELARLAYHHTVSSWSGWWSTTLGKGLSPSRLLHASTSNTPITLDLPDPSEQSRTVASTTDDEDGLVGEGSPRSRYTDAEWRAVVRHIAVTEGWADQTMVQKWQPLHEMFPHRSIQSFSAWYHRNEREVNARVRRERKWLLEKPSRRMKPDIRDRAAAIPLMFVFNPFEYPRLVPRTRSMGSTQSNIATLHDCNDGERAVTDAGPSDIPSRECEEAVLVNALCLSKHMQENISVHLERLHGLNSRSSESWKAQLLDNYENLNRLADERILASRDAQALVQLEKKSTMAHPTAASTISKKPLAPSRVKLPKIQIPTVPLRCPTPPSIVMKSFNGRNQFTKEDQIYALRFALWELKRDPRATKMQICGRLAEETWWCRKLPPNVLAQLKSSLPSRRVDRNSRDVIELSSEATQTPPRASTTDSEEEFPGWGNHETSAVIGHIAHTAAWSDLSEDERWTPLCVLLPHRSITSFSTLYQDHEDG
ncbi:hypothetical protein CERSUDRAFT_73865 [Gelatoporia subvermispora B]|uniref:Uncharacterized protein n=1 Tax=Ceriporiopsis subvermispora (strain B) TaxID=914234 RepID=M2QIG0_CERS8|nr:hypothetical protein CERSUDRAFT_73865 [Gelatoporia subvermispora B]